MINNHIIGEIEFLGVSGDDIEKAKEVLSNNNIKYNYYENSHSVACHQEAISVCDRMVNDGAEYDIDVSYDKNQEELRNLEDKTYEKLYATRNLDYGIYDNEFIYDVEQECINKFIEKIKSEA